MSLFDAMPSKQLHIFGSKCTDFIRTDELFNIVYKGLKYIHNRHFLEIILNLDYVTGEGNGNPLQNPCLENLMDSGAWWDTVHGVAKSRT